MSDDQQIQQLEGDIEQTRGDLADTISQIEERLNPSRLQDQATDVVQRVTDQILEQLSGRSGEITDKIGEQVNTAIQSVASSRIDALIGQAGPAVGGAGKSLWAKLADNPAVGALAAVGIGLLAAEETARRSGAMGGGTMSSGASSGSSGASGIASKVSDLASQATEALSGVTGQAGGTMSGLVDSAKQQAQGLTQGMSQGGQGGGGGQGGLGAMLSDSSVSSGLLAMGVGFLVGMAAPETEKERQALAPLDQKMDEQMGKMGLSGGPGGLVEQAKQAGGDLLGQAKEAASGAVDSAKQTAAQVGQQAKETAKQTAEQAKSSASSSGQ